MNVFWENGYEATSLDDLVRATGVSRHGIYGDFGGKQALFLASLDRYQHAVVTPALAALETETADFDALAAYFETQIARAEALGLPGPGCLVANTMTEIAPHDVSVREKVDAHNSRLYRAFLNTVTRAAPHLGAEQADAIAGLIVIFAQGLWSSSRVEDDASELRKRVGDFLDLISERMSNAPR